MGKGICVAGNMIVDILYSTQGWPAQGELVHIQDGITRATGGAVCNVLMDLAKLDPKMKLSALGRVGMDLEGDLILRRMSVFPNIDLSNVIQEGISSFTLVINDTIAKQRTFFTYSGAGGLFNESDIALENLDFDILHIGYILLLDSLDKEDAQYGSKMARLLHDVQEHGIRTSIDVVSEVGDRFKRLVPPALKYVDYCIINELEASQTTGIPLRNKKNELITENIYPTLCRMKEMGVKTWSVIHAPEGGYGLDENNKFVSVKSLRLPKGYIKGTVGAGDAFCAGVLCGAEKGFTLANSIKLGVAVAAASLNEIGATDGVDTIETVPVLDCFRFNA